MPTDNKKKKVLLIVNPQAGKMKSKIGMFDIINLFSSDGYIITTYCTSGPKDATMTVINHGAEHDMIVCCGGDGTLNEVISGIASLEKPIPLGYIPAGSTNDFARTLNMPLKIKKAANLISSGTPSNIDLGCLNKDIYFSYIASFGAFTKISYKTPQRLKNKFGHLAYIFGGIKHIAEIHPYKVKVIAEGFYVDGDFIFGAVTNTTSLGGIISLREDDVDLNDGKFEVLLIKNPQNPLDLKNIVNGLIKRKYDARYIYFFRTNHIELVFEDGASWTVDGEYGGRHEKVVIDNIHNAIQIIRS